VSADPAGAECFGVCRAPEFRPGVTSDGLSTQHALSPEFVRFRGHAAGRSQQRPVHEFGIGRVAIPREFGRHARDAVVICPRSQVCVKYLLVTPKVRESGRASRPQEGPILSSQSTFSCRRVAERLGWKTHSLSSLTGSNRANECVRIRIFTITRNGRFDTANESGKVEKLPPGASHQVKAGTENGEHPILENSTACTCQMPKTSCPDFGQA